MKVILVSPYSEHLVGGIISWTKYIVNYHHEHGDGVDMCLLSNEKAVQVMGAANPLKRLINGVGNYIPTYRQFKARVSEEHFDVAHICTSASFGLIRDLLIVKEARKRGIKTAVHMHFGRIPQIIQSKGWERSLFLRLMKRIDMAIVMDRASLIALENAGFKNVCFLPNPLSSEVLQLIEKQGEVRREPRTVVFAGHVVETKGVFELVEACRNICDVKVIILGKVATEDIKKKLLKVGGNNSSKWLNISGNKPLGDVIREMLTCSVFVLPSYSEGFPNVILESMACGCPIVATPVGAIPEMLAVDSEKPCGVCVPIKNVDALRNAIVESLNDFEKAAEMGRNAKKRVYEQYTMSKVWEQLVMIWDSL